ncbi:hypothetical protein K8Z61_16370 [Nocardioides sp. TRM66260-LWL]|uniref:hypothetical protein n=1 Tax=Nocardioides sp. TRM66260-LWL TaxID=2874478 RepID=UPI001CC4CFDB|nr:hypothetical protein [Nocardioides sp. TRM66260-LWL]MBZ5736071.1 hypothetical protein [Nocardioides sp. TRM66260-LWL]
MATPQDPVRDELFRDLRAFRKQPGLPSAARLNDLFALTEALGEGNAERAFDELTRYHDEHGTDPRTDIGAYFYLAGYDVGLDTIDQRRRRYVERFVCELSTAWRRAERGLNKLAALIRDHAERSRPWAVVSIFQSGNHFQPFLDFNLGYESWRPPIIQIDGHELAPDDFVVHRNAEDNTRFTNRLVLPEKPLRLDVTFGEPMARLRVIWPMPVWPVWNVVAWTADPRILTRLRTFRQRAVEVSLEWWRQTQPDQTDGLVTDGAIWAERTDPNKVPLPPGWRVDGAPVNPPYRPTSS